MTGPITPLATPSIMEWEEAGTSLANALSRYLNLCTSLGTNSLQEGAHANDLVARIDSKLESLHVSMEQQIAQARSALSKTLNDIASPLHCLPEEILTKIFTYVIYSAQYRYSKSGIYVAEMKDHLLQIYRSRSMLLGVCSLWKKTIEDRGYFWSIITIFQEPLDPQVDRDSKSWGLCREYREARNLSFDRAKNCSLDIACVFRDHFLPDIEPSTLAEYLPRIRTINIDSNSLSSTRHMIDAIIQEPSGLGSLSELSLCQREDQTLYYSTPTEFNHMYFDDPARLFKFNRLLESLLVLRITGVHMRWDMLAFSNRLVKLRLEAIKFGTDHTMVDNLCHALASATGLRELELVSIRSSHDSQKPSSSSRTISLPNLESLLVDNLQLNTLLCVLNWIATRSHRLTLHLTSYFRYFEGNPVSQVTGTNDVLWSALQRLPVHKLCIRSSLELRAQELRATVESVPMLDTLVLDKIVLTTEYCNALERQEPHGNESSSSSFPSLQHLRFGRTQIADVVAFKNMLASHSQSLRQMTLGGYVRTPIPQKLDGYLGMDEDRDKKLISQFREVVPDFSLIDSDYVLPEFQQNRWQLW